VNIGDRIGGAPDSEALVVLRSDGSSVSCTYEQLERRISACRQYLRGLGLRAGHAVGFLSDNSDHFVVAWYAALREGMVVVPVNHKLAASGIAHILGDAGVALVLVGERHENQVPEGFRSAPMALPHDRPYRSNTVASVDVGADDAAVVLYTSGSTGTPKGVPMTHRGYGWTIDTRLRGGPHTHHRLLVAAPLYHINALGAVTFALAAGATAVLMQRFDAQGYIRAIEQQRCTWLTSVPAMLAMVVRETGLLQRSDLSSVRLVRMGSSPVSSKLVQQVRQVFGDVSITNHYGTTEGGPLVFGGSAEGKALPDGAAGWPLPGVLVKLVDAAGADAGDQGELVYWTPATMKEYLNLPDRNCEALTPDGWYRTRDLFRRGPDGAYWFVSRIDDMFVCGGENIHPQEVERLLESNPAVQQACVVPVPDEIKGAKPVAFVVRREGAEVSESALVSFSLANGPAYQHPRKIYFLDDLPLAGTNKIDRKELMRRAREMHQ